MTNDPPDARRDGVDRRAQSSYAPLVWLAFIVVLAVSLRLLRLGEKSFWSDEGISYILARLDWKDFFHVLLRTRANMALYLVMLRFWILLGIDEGIVRGLSVIFSVATVPLIYVLGKGLFDARTGLIAALLLAVNAFHLWYAQEARSYSLLVFLVCLSFLFFHRGIERNSRRDWIGYVIASVLAIYGHFMAVLPLAAQLPAAVCLRPSAASWRRLIASLAAIAVLGLPLAFLIVRGDMPHTRWIPEINLDQVVSFFYALAGMGGRPLLLIYSIFFGIGLGHAFKRGALPLERRRVGAVLCWFGVPILLAIGLSELKPMFVHRYLSSCLPPFILLAALGISKVRSRRLLALALASVVVLALRGAYLYYYHNPKQNWRDASAYVLSNARTGDAAIFVTSSGVRPFEYYRDRSRARGSAPDVVPREEGYVRQTIRPADPAIDRLPLQYDRVWLLLSPISRGDQMTTSRALQTSMERHYDVVTGRQFVGVEVILYGKPRKE